MTEKRLFEHRISLYWIVGVLYMAITMFIPTSFSILRLSIFVVWFLVAIKGLMGNDCRIRIQRLGVVVLSVYLCYMIASSCYGCFNHEFDSFRNLRPYVFFPILHVIIFSRLKSEKDIKFLMTIMLCAEAWNCVFDLWYSLHGMGLGIWFPDVFYKLGLELSFNSGYETYYQYTTTHMVTHIFMLPFTAVIAFHNMTRKVNKWITVLLCMQFICLYLSGRAAFQLSAAICLCGIWGYNILIKFRRVTACRVNKKILVKVFSTILVVIPALCILMKMAGFGKSLFGIWDYASMKLQSVYSAGSRTGDIRTQQRVIYIQGWLESPFFGKGMGAFATEIDRGGLEPYATELTYVSMLFQYGIIGVVLFFSIVLSTARELCRKERRGVLSYETAIPFLFGMIAILLATAVDPYLFTLGCVWMLYLPFSVAFIVRDERGIVHE